MNLFDLKCYQKTYRNSQYWDDASMSAVEKQKNWILCRAMTDRFYDELVARGYLVPQSYNRR